MAKIMLVEDDNNLREIYEARLLAEGHEIISAHDGEEALAIAVREKPELIISDVMMPKISGFDMLDILRSSPETKNTKVIMMTALSQLEDKDRADRLGADRYLVKSQVTLEDVINVANEVLAGPKETAPTEPEPIAPIRGSDPAPQAPTAPVAEPPAQPVTPAPPVNTDTVPASDAAIATPATDPAAAPSEQSTSADPTATTASAPSPIEVPVAPAPSTEEPAAQSVPAEPTPEAPATPSEPAATPEAAPQPATEPETTEPAPATPEVDSEPSSPSMPKKIIQPLGDPLATPDLEALVAKEEEKEQVQKILTDADLNAAPQPAPEQPGQKPEDPNAIAL